ncbi:MAG: tRNA (adenosine(37)-N6)-dimethylallyltransferase MiaA [Actinobacteria bacterium]|nr:tRNA (adenosine(37)-N6)-dimethylallyltransferase MiaA [Actinomycetota bacterium]
MHHRRVLALVGPTASGKTDVALTVGRRGVGGHPVEIVAADAFTLYRGMDIATAKPSRAERAAVPHHMIDRLDPWQEASVARFQRTARAAVDAVGERGHVALLVGGSGLYFRAVVDDLRFPPTDPDVRARLEDAHRHDPVAAHAALATADPDAAARIDPGNLRRTVRALEVIELTGEPFSRFSRAWDQHRSIYRGLEVRGLDPGRVELRRRIHQRAQAMVAAGLLDEARRLAALPQPLSATAAQAIGYREALAVLDGELDADELPTAIASRSWRYAKRQLAWFRRDPRVRWSTPHQVLQVWS